MSDEMTRPMLQVAIKRAATQCVTAERAVIGGDPRGANARIWAVSGFTVRTARACAWLHVAAAALRRGFHQLAAAAASRRHRPRSSASGAPPTGFCKKEQRRRRLARVCEAQTRVTRRRFRCKFNALAIFRVARAAEDRPAQSRRRFRCRFNALATITAPRLRPRSATAPWPGQRPAPPVHYAKKVQRGPRRPHTTRANG